MVYDIEARAVQAVEQAGAVGAGDLADLVRKLAKPRIVWVMPPAGQPTEDAVLALSGELEAGDGCRH